MITRCNGERRVCDVDEMPAGRPFRQRSVYLSLAVNAEQEAFVKCLCSETSVTARRELLCGSLPVVVEPRTRLRRWIGPGV